MESLKALGQVVEVDWRWPELRNLTLFKVEEFRGAVETLWYYCGCDFVVLWIL